MSWAQSFSRCWTDKWYEREQSEAKLNGFLEEKHTASEHPHCWINIHVYPYMHIPCEIFAIYRIGRLEHIHGKGNDSQKSDTFIATMFYQRKPLAKNYHIALVSPKVTAYIRADSRFAPSQWETSLPSNIVSHRLATNVLLHSPNRSFIFTLLIYLRKYLDFPQKTQ